MSTIRTSSSGSRLSKISRGHHLLLGATRSQVGGQDQDGVAEVHGATLPIGEPAFVEHLQQHVEHVRVRLFHLVEQHHL